MTTMTQTEWEAEGERRFGPDQMQWRFVCPACGHAATPADWQAAGMTINQVGFSCVGRALAKARGAFEAGPGPCNYAGGGLIGLNPVRILSPDGIEHRLFAFAEANP